MLRRTVGRNRKAVAPVLATLLMIAVAVAMSVIIFMWSQGFLANTSTSVGGQQGAQNQAAQSSIAIEDVTFTKATNSTTIIIRNVGAVSVDLGSLTLTPGSANPAVAGQGHFYNPVTVSTLAPSFTATGVSSGTCSPFPLAKGESATIQVTLNSAAGYGFKSGDVVTIKVTTKVGTFAQATFTVP